MVHNLNIEHRMFAPNTQLLSSNILCNLGKITYVSSSSLKNSTNNSDTLLNGYEIKLLIILDVLAVL